MILLGVDYLRTRWRGLLRLGCLSVLLGVAMFVVVSARVIRLRTWRLAVAVGVFEIALAIARTTWLACSSRITRLNRAPGARRPCRCASATMTPGRLDRFWTAYRQNTTYNLTDRNCSSTVSHALEAALEGASARSGARPRAGGRFGAC